MKILGPPDRGRLGPGRGPTKPAPNTPGLLSRRPQPSSNLSDVELIVFPAHALMILEERLREQEAEGVEMPAGMQRDELSLRVLIAAEESR
jgi:hypothetical protein